MKAVLALSCVLSAVAALGQGVTLPQVTLAPFAPAPAALTGPLHPQRPMEAKAPTLGKAGNVKDLLRRTGIQLTPEQKKQLEQHRFVLIGVTGTNLEVTFDPPANEKDDDGQPMPDHRSTPDEMLAGFDSIAADTSNYWSRSPGQAKYITADLALHACHRFYSQALEFVEQRQLRARLEDTLERAMAACQRLGKDASPEAKKRLEVVAAQLTAAWCVLGRETEAAKSEDESFEGMDPEVRKEMERANPPTDARTVVQRLAAKTGGFSTEVAAHLKAEVANVMSAEAASEKGLFLDYDPLKKADYSQFRVRSHYTKTEELKGYFRCMMLLGRNGYALNPESGPPTLGLTDSLLLSMALALPDKGGKSALDGWREIMEITGFFAGQSDDLTYSELRAWVVKTLGREMLRPEDAVDAKVLGQLKAAINELRVPQIVADERGRERQEGDLRPEFRLFGQRFSFDAWILNQFITDKLTMPSGLFIPAAFGDAEAEAFAVDFIRERFTEAANQVEPFQKTLVKLRESLKQVSDLTWFGSLAGQQLHALSQLAGDRNEHYPAFMRDPLHASKDIESMLGHWTEIKHDTVLYAKQSYAELGEGGNPDRELPPLPLGFVQPDVGFWREMERLADFMCAGFLKHDLLPGMERDEFAPLNRFHRHMQLCRKLAEKEVAGTPLTPAEYESIWTFSLTYMDNPLDMRMMPDPERGKSALITDVHTDAYSNEVLQEALGRPCVLLALVGTEKMPRLVAGMAYQHFEFTGPQDKRATDEEWHARVYVPKPDLPPRAKWAVPVFPAMPVPEPKAKAE